MIESPGVKGEIDERVSERNVRRRKGEGRRRRKGKHKMGSAFASVHSALFVLSVS